MRGNLEKYFELTKPKVTLLNLLVGVTCFVLGTFPQTNLPSFCIFLAVGYLAAGGCGVLNCVYDWDTDSLMPRTSKRAIPSGFVSIKKALSFGAVLIGVSIVLSQLFFNTLTTLMVIFGVVFYLLVYTILLKRASPWNVVIGGLAGCFAGLSGWTAATNTLNLAPLLIAAIDFLWTPGHLWGLAMKKVKEYRIAQIPMLPVTFGLGRAAQFILLFNAATVVSSLLIPLLGGAGSLFMLIASSSGFVFLLETSKLAISPTEHRGFRVFLMSMPYLTCIMLGLLADKFVTAGI
jgi:protoheme IX farnesyltransferase